MHQLAKSSPMQCHTYLVRVFRLTQNMWTLFNFTNCTCSKQCLCLSLVFKGISINPNLFVVARIRIKGSNVSLIIRLEGF